MPQEQTVITKDPGHSYDVVDSSGKVVHVLDFLKKLPDDLPGMPLVTVRDGLTNEAVLKVLIDRMEYLQDLVPSDANERVIRCLRDALTMLRARTEDRVNRGVESTNQI